MPACYDGEERKTESGEEAVIRKMKTDDLEDVLQIWLESNLQAHHFIEETYWRDHANLVRSLLPQAEVLVYEEDKTGEILGFLGLMENHIAGLFVRKEARSKGIGRALLKQAEKRRPFLTLQVYEKNAGALRFYQREGFQTKSEGVDEETGQKERTMIWKREVSARIEDAGKGKPE